MAGVNGISAMFGLNEVKQIFDEFISEQEDKQLEMLQRAGEDFVNKARDLKTYQDDTGNLRSSIGYIILKDGEIIDENFQVSEKGTDKKTGLEKGRTFAEEIAQEHPDGFVLIGVAGMHYAAALEREHKIDVISGSALSASQTLKEILEAYLSE